MNKDLKVVYAKDRGFPALFETDIPYELVRWAETTYLSSYEGLEVYRREENDYMPLSDYLFKSPHSELSRKTKKVSDTDPNKVDTVNHPSHYTAYKGLEVIQLTEQMNFNRGNAVKYISRAGLKNPETEVEDLKKAAWYINREIERLGKEAND
jgi:Protein of unknwon function (DUF3310)